MGIYNDSLVTPENINNITFQYAQPQSEKNTTPSVFVNFSSPNRSINILLSEVGNYIGLLKIKAAVNFKTVIAEQFGSEKTIIKIGDPSNVNIPNPIILNYQNNGFNFIGVNAAPLNENGEAQYPAFANVQYLLTGLVYFSNIDNSPLSRISFHLIVDDPGFTATGLRVTFKKNGITVSTFDRFFIDFYYLAVVINRYELLFDYDEVLVIPIDNASPVSVYVKPGANPAAACAAAQTEVFLLPGQTPFQPGQIVFTDLALTIPLTGFDYITYANTLEIFSINPATGQIIATTGVFC
jgi:hypothetical protein